MAANDDYDMDDAPCTDTCNSESMRELGALLSATSIVNSTTMAPNAATRVFAIPELLEMILVDLAETIKPEESIRAVIWHTSGVRQPKRQLFPLRRICKGAFLTINGSPKLRRALCLDSESTTPDFDYSSREFLQFEPFLWFLDLARIQISSFTPAERRLSNSRHIYSCDDKERFWQVWGTTERAHVLLSSPNASWRDIKAAAYRDVEIFNFSVRLSVTKGGILQLGWTIPQDRCLIWEYELRPETKLGSFYDEYLQFIKESKWKIDQL